MRPWFLLCAALFLVCGCPHDDDDDTTADDDDDDDACDGGSSITLTNAHNYNFIGTLDIAFYEMKELTSVELCWDSLTTDLQGHDLDLDDLDFASVVVFRYLSQEEVAQGISENNLQQSDVSLYVEAELVDGQTCVNLGDLSLFGNDIDVEQYFEDGYGTWLFTLNTGSTPGVGSRMAVFLEPIPGNEVESIQIQDGDALVTVDADLTGLTDVPLPLGETATVSWDGLTVDGQGNEMQLGSVDRLMVAQYATLTPADLEANFLDLELIADAQWDLVLEGQHETDLAILEGDGGTFAGISDEGTWILALRCDTCANPAPPFLTILTVCQ